MVQGKFNPAALAALPIAILLTLSALLPYFGGDFYSYNISGWSFFSSVDQLMVLSILLAGVLLAAAVVPELKDGTVEVTLSDRDKRSFDFPLIFVPAVLLALLAGVILFLIALRILSPPSGLSPAVGIFFGAFLAVALVASAAATIVFEIAPPRIGGWAAGGATPGAATPYGMPNRQPAPPPPPAAQPTREMPPSRPTAPAPPPAAEPPPPAPETRRA